MQDFIQIYGPFILAGGGIFGAWYLGVNRNQWAIEQFKADLTDLKTRVTHLETQGQAGATALASIAATLVTIQDTLREIKSDLRGKADK